MKHAPSGSRVSSHPRLIALLLRTMGRVVKVTRIPKRKLPVGRVLLLNKEKTKSCSFVISAFFVSITPSGASASLRRERVRHENYRRENRLQLSFVIDI
tara:strand:- start:24 stop:320 length:297 start_codon:yes stop_codon:yes gene_type:complete